MKILPLLARAIIRVLLAALAIALSSGLLLAFRGFFSTSVVALLYLLVVVLCATIGGFTSGIMASVFAFLTFNYLFLPPFNTFTVAHTQDITGLFVFLTVAVIISDLMGRAQNRLEQIQTRERESTHLFELSSALTATRGKKPIAEVLAYHLLQALDAYSVEVRIHSNLPGAESSGVPDVQVRMPQVAAPAASHRQTQVLATNHGVLGEIQLWTKRASLTTNEKRLLQTIASEAALAVERTLFAESENRARVLEESDRLKTAILSSVSHDLRTPLASIQAAASSLYDTSIELEPGARRELQSLLLEETEHLNQLVGNLLNMSRIEAGALKLQKQWNSMADLIDTAVERMQLHVHQHDLVVNVPEDLPLVQVDAVLIEQVFINLISNSVKYAPVDSQILILAYVQDPHWMQVSLTNHGPAIPDEHLEHIFEKFYRYPGMKQESSTGLGLSICKGIIEAHGGRIWAVNSTAGLAFCFTLPLEKSESLHIPEDDTASEDEHIDRES